MPVAPPAILEILDHPRRLASAILVAAAATIGGALVFQHGLGYVPCKLCLEQRVPYYAAMPLALLIAALASARRAWGSYRRERVLDAP